MTSGLRRGERCVSGWQKFWLNREKAFWMGWIAVAGLICSVSLGHSQGVGVPPESQPLLQQADLEWEGSFKLPRFDAAGGLSDFQYGATSAAYNPANDSLFVQGRDGYVAEIGIPDLTKSASYGALATGSVLQPFSLLDDQRLSRVNNPNDMHLRGMLVHKGELVASFASFYDATYAQTTSHIVRPLNLNVKGQGRGPFKVGTVMPGHVAGYMSPIPADWQSLFGSVSLTGNFGLPIVTRESWGPAAFGFNPAQLGLINPTPGQALLDYPDINRALGPWDGQSNAWNSTTTFAGVAFIAGTRSVLFFGVHGTGPFCYGEGGVVNPNTGDTWCYDPQGGFKGGHAYPYVYRVWAYDALDLLGVKQGSKNSWEPRPYGTWDLTLPMASVARKMPSVAYDPDLQRIFVIQGFGDTDDPQGFPVVHVYASSVVRKPRTPLGVHMVR
jgi:hypothetical protein